MTAGTGGEGDTGDLSRGGGGRGVLREKGEGRRTAGTP